MRCLSCDCNLSDYEATRKYENGEYIDLCNRCFSSTDLRNMHVIVRDDLEEYQDVEDDLGELPIEGL
jgi:hypothetical protein